MDSSEKLCQAISTSFSVLYPVPEVAMVMNNVPDNKKAARLLTLIGGRMYALLKS